MTDTKKPDTNKKMNAEAVFSKLKTHFEPKKVDAWQEKWLAVPDNRKKYEKLTDAPEVVGEELLAMTNDIIDFIQGEEGGKSEVLKKIKSKMSGFLKNPIGFLQKQAVQGKALAEKVGNGAKKETEKAKTATKKTGKKAAKAAKK